MAPTVTPLGRLPTAALGPAKAAALQSVLDAAVRQGAPDAIAAVITPGGTWSGASGIGGPDGRKATATDEFAIASVTKLFTAALVMRLVEAGRMDLDAPLATYLGPPVDHAANGATVRQALGMRSGLADFGPADKDAIGVDAGRVWAPADVVARLAPPAGAPGDTYRYANANYLLLALAAEHVTGTTFAVALRREVLDPVGATRILQQGAGVPTPKPWALPTASARDLGFGRGQLGAGDAISCISSASFSFGYGSVASDAPSLAAWAWRLFSGDVVDTTSLRVMLPTGDDPHGLGLERLTDLGDATAFGQTGSKTGYGSVLVVVPAERTVVALFVNDPDFIVEPLVRQLIEASRGG